MSFGISTVSENPRQNVYLGVFVSLTSHDNKMLKLSSWLNESTLQIQLSTCQKLCCQDLWRTIATKVDQTMVAVKSFRHSCGHTGWVLRVLLSPPASLRPRPTGKTILQFINQWNVCGTNFLKKERNIFELRETCASVANLLNPCH